MSSLEGRGTRNPTATAAGGGLSAEHHALLAAHLRRAARQRGYHLHHLASPKPVSQRTHRRRPHAPRHLLRRPLHQQRFALSLLAHTPQQHFSLSLLAHTPHLALHFPRAHLRLAQPAVAVLSAARGLGRAESGALPDGRTDEHQPAGRGELRGDRAAGRRGGAGANDRRVPREANRVLFGVFARLLQAGRVLQGGGLERA